MHAKCHLRVCFPGNPICDSLIGWIVLLLLLSRFSHVRLCATPWTAATCRHLPGPSVHGIFQARVLEWIAIAFSGLDCIPL